MKYCYQCDKPVNYLFADGRGACCTRLSPEEVTGVSERKRYNIIYADPGWQYEDTGDAGKRGASHHYTVSSLKDLINLPVQDLAADDCLLAMWWVPPMPIEALTLVDAWGFTLKTMKGLSWHKTTKTGLSHFGMGHWTRANMESVLMAVKGEELDLYSVEDCLLATRGKPKRVSASVRQFIEAPVGRHSEKPAEARDRLVQLMGDVPRIELFARHSTPGWDVWGNEVDGVNIFGGDQRKRCTTGEPDDE
jgi:N6-adenosine-specific RNA methylase IME4